MDRFEFFAKLPRNEPGAATFTSAYLTPVVHRPGERLLDLGAAGGDRATWVARSRCSPVVAFEEEARFLPRICQRAAEGGAGRFVQPVCGKLTALPFADGAFAVVMAEGAAFKIGFERALNLWRRVVAPQGFLAVTYPGVVNRDAPAEVRAPLEKRLVEPLGTLADYHALIRGSGFELVHQVPLQAELWDAFYGDITRHAWALISAGATTEEDPLIRAILDEALWYRRAGRGRVFLQAFLLRRPR